MKITDEKKYQKDREAFRKLMEEKLKAVDPFATNAIECLLKDNNDKSAFMVWLSFKGLYDIKLSKDEETIEQNWYYWFGK